MDGHAPPHHPRRTFQLQESSSRSKFPNKQPHRPPKKAKELWLFSWTVGCGKSLDFTLGEEQGDIQQKSGILLWSVAHPCCAACSPPGAENPGIWCQIPSPSPCSSRSWTLGSHAGAPRHQSCRRRRWNLRGERDTSVSALPKIPPFWDRNCCLLEWDLSPSHWESTSPSAPQNQG